MDSQETIHPEEIELFKSGGEYRQMKQTEGWRRLVSHMVKYCNHREEQLRTGSELDDRATLRLIDQWRSTEQFYQEIITEIDGTIQKLEEKEAELRESGIQYPELSLGPTAQGE